MSSKKKKNVIHWITRISIIGIATTTAALIILIAAFNGIEMMVEKLYSDFDSNITVRSSKGKSFLEDDVPFDKLKKIESIRTWSKAVEEIVIVRHEKKSVKAQIYGVEDSFLQMSSMPAHLIDGKVFLRENEESFGLIGAGLLDKLQAFIPQNDYESILIYFPKRDAKIGGLKNPFRTSIIKLSGRFNFNRDVNEEALVLPLSFAQEQLDYSGRINALYINCKNPELIEETKIQVQNLLGNDFIIKTQFEKNALIYQTSKTEKIVVICILIFVFILALFNLIASLTMLYIEKKPNIVTIQSFGGNDRFVFKIFFFQGLLIAGKGIVYGMVLGGIIVFIQRYGHVLILPNSGGQPFPIAFSVKDSLLVFGIVSIISILASYLTITFLIKNFKSLKHE